MRVLVYGLSYDKRGGIESFLFNMNKYMNDCVFDYIIEGTSSVHEKLIRERGGKIYYIPPKKNMIGNLAAWRKILKENKKVYKTVYFNLYSLAWIAPIMLCRAMNYKVVVHSHNNMLHDCSALYRKTHEINKAILRKMKITRLTNSDLSSVFMFGDSESGRLICNAVDVDRFAFDQSVRDELREKLNIQDKHVFGFVGRIAYQKNPEFLIRVFKEIATLDDKAYLIMLGEGELEDTVKRMVREYNLQDKVLLPGNLPDVERYYQAMDVFLLPSRFEGLGIVLVEAQTAGLPCITSKDVVPDIVALTDLVQFISLEEPEKKWAEAAVAACNPEADRSKYHDQIGNSRYNIRVEAPYLEKVLGE